jgi:murein DD-endopeptidase MepM/ murein hydrolase activator NlpD
MWHIVVGAALGVVLAVSAAPGPSPPDPSSAPERAVSTSSARAAPAAKRFWVKDKHRYSSPWYAGSRRKMIGFGCTPAPYYEPDPRCTRNRGYHHGLDLAMPCGNRLFAGFRGWVVDPSSAGSLGAAYGRHAFRIRNHRKGVDVVIGHVRRVYVEPGDRVRKGRLVARASDAAAPDGCHLHFEVRPIGDGYRGAVRPHAYLGLRR